MIHVHVHVHAHARYCAGTWPGHHRVISIAGSSPSLHLFQRRRVWLRQGRSSIVSSIGAVNRPARRLLRCARLCR